MKCDISLIIPAYNEESRILPSLQKISHYLSERYPKHEIIVVDDGSSDRTGEIVNEFSLKNSQISLLRNDNNYGKGYSVRRGFSHAAGKLRLFTDADLSTPIQELDNLLKKIDEGFDVVIGSRGEIHSTITEHQPFYREWMGKFFNFLIQMFLFKGIKDTQCGFKLFTEKAGSDMFARQKINRFCFDVELLYIAQRLNYKISVVPVEWENSVSSKVSLLSDPVIMILDLFRIRWLHRFLNSRKND
jgi:dolichyl-phosphate beta-glucosyltransferase